MTVLRDKKIVIVSQSHICRNPRVLKEALTLSKESYNVTVLTAIYSEDLLQEDFALLKGTNISYKFYSDLRLPGIKSYIARLVRKIAIELQLKLKIESIRSLGFKTGILLKKCASYSADLYIMHQELPTYIGTKMVKQGYKVAFDIEDWYSEDLLPIAQIRRPLNLLKRSESEAVNNGAYCTTTSAVLAHQLALVYSSNEPEVIYNVFPARPDLKVTKTIGSPVKLFWFSQNIGPGRGLEEFIKLLHNTATKLELHLLGNISNSYQNHLKVIMPAKYQLFFHELVSEINLANKIAEFDIGLALELQSPPSRNYTITNKFFQYLQAGLPVIASETAGQNEAFDKFEPGFKLAQNPGDEEIAKLDNWLSDKASLMASKQKAIEAARFYNWENESKKLIQLVKNILEPAC
jgi:glycosyltransferase involved in cell wall biosynthesis